MLEQNQKVYFTEGKIKGFGVINGLLSIDNKLNIYIINPEIPLKDYPYSHIICQENYVTPVENIHQLNRDWFTYEVDVNGYIISLLGIPIGGADIYDSSERKRKKLKIERALDFKRQAEKDIEYIMAGYRSDITLNEAPYYKTIKKVLDSKGIYSITE